MAWYKNWFGKDYLRVYPHRDITEARSQINFVERVLPLKNTDKVLDLGCGNGRHAHVLAERGYPVICLDLSIVLLQMARKNRQKPGFLNFVQADMRSMPFCAIFDYVLSFFTTFGYFDNSTENLRTLKSIERALVPGGFFLQDYLNKDYVVNNIVARDEREQDGFHIVQERQYNRAAERIEKKITVHAGNSKREYFESVRLYTLEEMRELLAETDLVLEKTYGDFDGRPLTKDSPRLIMIGKRRMTS